MWPFISQSKRSHKNNRRHKFRLTEDPALESRELLATTTLSVAALEAANIRGRIVQHAIVNVIRGTAGGTILGQTVTEGAGRKSTPNTSLINGGRTVTTSTPAFQTTPSIFSQPTFISATGQTTNTTPTSINSDGSFNTTTSTSTSTSTTTGSTTTGFTTITTGSTTMPFGSLGTASNGQTVVFV